MSHENVEIVRRFSNCWERLDWEGLSELVDPDIEQHGAVGGLEEGRVLRGFGEIMRDYEIVERTWDEHRIERQEMIDAGDRVVVFLREYQRGKKSGIELVVETAVIADLRDGRIVRVQGYMDRAAALEAAGVTQNVETVRRMVAHAQAGEWDRAMEMISPDVELDQSRFVDGGVYRGREAYRDFFRHWFGTWDDLTIEAERFLDAGDQVVVFIKVNGRGKGSGAPVEIEAADVWTVEDGTPVRLVGYIDRAEALADAGIVA